MSEVVTGIAELGQGALTARVIEPAHGEPIDGHTHESACLNCGTALVGTHCHGCGQAAHVHRSIGAFFHDLAHGVFHVEGKIWRTLPLLVLRPGRLTREYIDGRRASYISPIALFLFTVFLLFAVIHLFEGKGPSVAVYTSVDQAAADQQRTLDTLVRKRAETTDPGDRSGIDQKIAAARGAIDGIKRVQASGLGKRLQWSNGDDVHSDVPRLDRGIKAFRANPDLAIYKLQMSAYKYSWLLIPISVPMLWLLFPFSRRFKLYDHTVFVTYSLAFMTLLALVVSFGDAAGVPSSDAVLLLVPVHMYRQLRGTYGVSRVSALWRTASLMLFAAFALAVFATALLSVELAE